MEINKLNHIISDMVKDAISHSDKEKTVLLDILLDIYDVPSYLRKFIISLLDRDNEKLMHCLDHQLRWFKTKIKKIDAGEKFSFTSDKDFEEHGLTEVCYESETEEEHDIIMMGIIKEILGPSDIELLSDSDNDNESSNDSSNITDNVFLAHCNELGICLDPTDNEPDPIQINQLISSLHQLHNETTTGPNDNNI